MKVQQPPSALTQALQPTSTNDAKAVKETAIQNAGSAAAKRARSESQVADSARVEVSNRAQDIKRAKELATPSQGIDEAKVARLQKLIDSGEYRVDAGALADRILDEHMKMPL